MLRVFIGYDPRQPVAYNVCAHSIQRHASVPVSVTMLKLDQLPLERRGLTEFTYSRFLVPWLCGFEGPAVFMDSDIVVTGDIKELFDQLDPECAVQVNQDQPRFEWPSVMLFNCGNCQVLTPDFIEGASNPYALDWGKVGKFSPEWNRCVGYVEGGPAKLYHYTAGVPVWFQTQHHAEDEHWQREREAMNHTVKWEDLMLKSVHAQKTVQRMLARMGVQ